MGKKGMKIALVRRDYTSRVGGAEKYLITLSHELSKMGEEIHIFAHTFDQPPDPRIQIHPVPMLPVISPLKNLSFAFNTQKELKKLRCDIICSLSRGFYHDIFRISDGLHLYHMKQRYKNGMNYLLKTLTPRHQTLLYLEKKSFRQDKLRRIIAISHLTKAQVREYYGIPEEKVEVIYNGIDPLVFNPSVRERYCHVMREKFGIKKDEAVILFVAMDLERKGLGFLLEALSLIRERKFKLFIVGKANSRNYQMIAEKLKLRERVRFMGYQSRIEEIYGMGDMLVLPTLYDPFSNCCLEAMACGIPVITTRQNGVSELIKDGNNGFVVDEAGKVNDIAKKIDLLLLPETREKMGSQAVLSVEGLTAETNAKKILKLFQDVLEEKKKA